MKFTKACVTALKPESRRKYYDDDSLPGFRLVVSPNGNKTFAVRIRFGGRSTRQERTKTIGRFGVLTVEQAREEALKVLAQVRLGQNPLQAKADPVPALSVGEVCAEFLRDQEGKLKPKTAYEYRRIVSREIVPVLGARVAEELDSLAVSRWHSTLGENAPGLANNALRLLRSIYRWAHARGLVSETVQPSRRVKPFPERKVERFLSSEEIGRLVVALRRSEEAGVRPDPVRHRLELKRAGRLHDASGSNETSTPYARPINPFAVAAIRFLLLTGWRKSEALSLRWDAIDWQRGQVDLADSKTGRSIRQLGAPALQLLSSLTRFSGSPWVFPGLDPAQHLVDLKHVWQAIRHEAGLADVRLHDLRHTFASHALGAGCSLAEVGKLLGHRDLNSTQRYAHLADEAIRSAADEVASRLAWLMKAS